MKDIDRPRENCGVIGVYSPKKGAVSTALMGMMCVQHRGQEGAGLVASDGQKLTLHKGEGFVSSIFTPAVLSRFGEAALAIGHIRYSTSGTLNAVQPFIQDGLAIAHNGNLTNVQSLKQQLPEFAEVPSDTWVALQLFSRESGGSWEEKLRNGLPKLRGAYNFVAMTTRELFIIRDPWGFRPLVLGTLRHGGWVVASETCALEPMAATFVREVMPGEGIIIDQKGLATFYFDHRGPLSRCIFEYIYIARPDSRIFGQEVHTIRKRCGIKLFEESPVEADVILSIPHSGDSAARGFSAAAKIPMEEGVFANRYVGRAFIEPLSRRKNTTRLKYGVIKSDVAGKRICAIDDSIVRGDASANFVRLLKESGAKEVHLRIASPPLKFPCFFGVDFATHGELAAHRLRDVSAIRAEIRADSLAYLTIEGLVEAVTGVRMTFRRSPSELFASAGFCGACFTGKYPVAVEDVIGKEDQYLTQKRYQEVYKRPIGA